MAHQLAPSVNCSLDDIDLNALKADEQLHVCIRIFASGFKADIEKLVKEKQS